MNEMNWYLVLFSQLFGCQSLKFGDCGLTRSCTTLPEGCKPSAILSDTVCTVISWRTKEDGIYVTVYGENTDYPGDWVGVGFSKTGRMAKSDTYICKRLGKDVKFVSALLAGAPAGVGNKINRDPEFSDFSEFFKIFEFFPTL